MAYTTLNKMVTVFINNIQYAWMLYYIWAITACVVAATVVCKHIAHESAVLKGYFVLV